jgi:hypothetical protein
LYLLPAREETRPVTAEPSRFLYLEIDRRRKYTVEVREVGSDRWRQVWRGETDAETGLTSEELRAIGGGRHWIAPRG